MSQSLNSLSLYLAAQFCKSLFEVLNFLRNAFEGNLVQN